MSSLATFLLVYRPKLRRLSIGKRMPQLREAVSESQMGHFASSGLSAGFAVFNHREVDVIINVDIFNSNPQAG